MKNLPLLTTILIILVTGGCMVGPDYKPPKTQAPPAWSGATNSAAAADTRLTTNAVELAQWWTRFQDPKLTELVSAALRTNLDVRLAEALLREARAVRGRDAGGLWPSASVTGSATRTGAVSGSSTGVLQAGAGAVWNLDFFGLTRRQLESDDAAIQAAGENIYNAQVTLVS